MNGYVLSYEEFIDVTSPNEAKQNITGYWQGRAHGFASMGYPDGDVGFVGQLWG